MIRTLEWVGLGESLGPSCAPVSVPHEVLYSNDTLLGRGWFGGSWVRPVPVSVQNEALKQ